MDKISSYTVGVTVDALKSGFEEGIVPEILREPMQSLLPRITDKIAQRPITIYLCSDENNADVRNFFGYALAGTLRQHVPSVLLVDCSFLETGMSGIVPQKDALGFLDLLLYGSSIGVITQQTSGGIKVVGAGSFPVTKKMPFVLTAFEDAARRLGAHSRCVIFCGPVNDDDDNLHPIIGAVDLPVLVGTGGTVGIVDPVEEQIAAAWDKEMLSVRISPVKEAAAPTVGAAEAGRGFRDKVEEPRTTRPGPDTLRPEIPPRTTEDIAPVPPAARRVRPAPDEAGHPARAQARSEEPPLPEPPRAGEPRSAIDVPLSPAIPPGGPRPADTIRLDEEELAAVRREKRYTSLIPKIATAAIVLVVVVFAVWWFGQKRPGPTEPARVQTGTDVAANVSGSGADETGTGEVDAAQTQAAETETPAGEDRIGEGGQITAQEETPTDVGEVTAAESTPTDAAATMESVPDEPSPTAGRRIDPEDIIVEDDLKKDWPGTFIVHISSFREAARARNEVEYLLGRGFDVFIVFLNLGAKGDWYRVYAGPVDTREEARNLKKLLDDDPRVRFTRIKPVSE